MKNYLKFSVYFLSLAIMLTSFTSCNEDDEVLLANLNVNVEYAADITGLSVENLTVTITNTTDNSTESVITSPSGRAEFIDMAPGTYNISCSVSLSAEDAQSAIGYFQEITLNAVNNNVDLFGGETSMATLTLDGQPSADLLIKEIYYTGPGPFDFAIFSKDQFVEIYNNSNETIYADGLYVAILAPFHDGSDPSAEVSTLNYENFIYAEKMLQVPGSGQEYPIAAGESIVIALNAVDWTEDGAKADRTVDLSDADFDTYAMDWLNTLGRTGNVMFDVDNVDVPTMECIYLANYANHFNLRQSGTSIAIFRNESYTVETIADPMDPTDPEHFAKIAISDVIDAVDGMYNAQSAAFKRLPVSLDAGFNYCEGFYVSKSLRRKIAKTTTDGRHILLDTNNSSNDFEVTSLPTPRGFGN